MDAPIVVAKQTFAEQSAASNMTCSQLKASDAKTDHYEVIWHPEQRDA